MEMFQSQIDHIDDLREKYYQQVEELLKPEYEKLNKLKEQYKKHCDLIFNNKQLTMRSYRVLINKTHDYKKIQCIYEGLIPSIFEQYFEITLHDNFTTLSLKMDESVYPLDNDYWIVNWISDHANDEAHNGDFEKIINYIL